MPPEPAPADVLASRLASLDWQAVERGLWRQGYAHVPSVLRAEECRDVAALYADDRLFRSRIEMSRYRFGEGEYKYFAPPLPTSVRAMRESAYPHLAPVANAWMEALGLPERYPPTLDAFLARCAARGQTRPTPLLLRYETGGYNCLHQDLYGDLAFPFQLVVFLSEPEADYTGGEFVLVEQRPRAQSVPHVIAGRRGDLVVFTTRYRPVKGARGYYRANVRHGVSRVLSGSRMALGIIFHDAR